MVIYCANRLQNPQNGSLLIHSKIEVDFQGQIKTVLNELLADLDIKVKKIFQKLRIQSYLTAAGNRKNYGYTAIELVYAMVMFH